MDELTKGEIIIKSKTITKKKNIRLNSDKLIKSFNTYFKNYIVLILIGILSGRALILDELMPFGIAFFYYNYSKDRKGKVFAYSALLGTYLGGGFRHIIAMILLVIVEHAILNKQNKGLFRQSLVATMITFLVGVIYSYFKSFYLYDLLIIAFESLVVFVYMYILSYGLPILTKNSNRRLLSNEEIICLAIISGVAVLGIDKITIYGISIKNTIGIYITLLFAYCGGAGIGASVGITIGIITSMINISTSTIISIYGFAGLLAGIFKEVGKIASGLGIILASAILSFYIPEFSEVNLYYKEVFIAFVLFLVTPNKLLIYVKKLLNAKVNMIENDRFYSERIKKLIRRQLKDFSNAFEELAVTYSNIAEKEQIFEEREIAQLVDEVANNICSTCSMRRNCWENYFYSTYNGITDAITLIEEYGEIDEKSMPEYLRKKCLRTEKLIDGISSVYRVYRVGYEWSKKLFEMRKVVSQQFNGMSSIIKNLNKEILMQIEFKKEVEDSLYVALDKVGILVDSITVFENEDGIFQIDIKKIGDIKDSWIVKVTSIVSNVIKKEITVKGIKKSDDTCSHIQLVETKKFKVLTKISKLAKDTGNISGDSTSFINLKNGKYMLALSDGMGSGIKASKESMAAITLLEQLFEAGFSKDIVIKTINSVLISKSLEEVFSTIDLVLIDLYNARAEFIKIGSVSSYIIRSSGEVISVDCSSLPAGIISDIFLDTKNIKLEDGDYIVMVSDGVLDVDKNLLDKGSWVKQYLEKNTKKNPQSIADGLIDMALSKGNKKVEDDMTVMVTKIWENK